MNKISIDVYNEHALKTPIICLHGFLETKEMWSNLHLFFLDYPIYCLDLPGHGKSKLSDSVDCSIETIAKMVVEALDALNITEFYVIGHSMGGYVGLSLLELIPKRIKTLVLLNSNYFADSDAKKKDRLRTLKIMQTKPDWYFKQAFESLFIQPELFKDQIDCLIKRATDFERFGILFAMECIMNRKDHADLVKLYREKVFYIQGEKDAMFIKPDVLLLDEMHWCTIPKSKHMSIFENRDCVLSYIQQYCFR